MTGDKLPQIEPLPKAEKLERVVAITSLKIGKKQGFRVVWPCSRPTDMQTYTDFYIVEENGMFTLMSQMTSVSPQKIIKDLYKSEAGNNSELTRLAYKCAREKAEELARQLQEKVEDYSGYANRADSKPEKHYFGPYLGCDAGGIR